MKLQKVILITGASSGIGFESAKALIRDGHIVYGAARRVERMKELEEMGGHVLELDVTNEENLQQAVAQILNEQGRVDVLWNNAGYGLYGAVEDINLDEAKYQFDVNLFSVARLTQLVVPHMRKQKAGTIINTSSMGGKVYSPLGAWYHATKYALEGWSDCLRLELKEFGINVVLLEPGAIHTEFGEPLLESLKKSSESSAYKKIIDAVVDVTENSYTKPGAASSPKVISDTVVNIVNSSRPSTRYLVGKYAKPAVLFRRCLGDRAYDKMVMTALERMRS